MFTLHDFSSFQVPRYFSHTYMCHSKSVTALKYFIQRPGVINWEEPVTFTGMVFTMIN